MAAWNILKQFGVWTTILKWREPFIFRIRLKGDALIRLAIAFGAGLVGMAILLFLIATKANPDPAINTLFGFFLLFLLTAGLLFFSGDNVSGDIRLCEEGIIRNRFSTAGAHMEFQETTWPYESIGQATFVPAEAIGKSFSLLFLSSPGSWDMIGLPRRISPPELAYHFTSRGIPVQSADMVPEEFTHGLHWSWAIGSFGISLPLLAAGLLFYSDKAPLIGPNQFAANQPQRQPQFVPPPQEFRQRELRPPRDFAPPRAPAPEPPVIPPPIDNAAPDSPRTEVTENTNPPIPDFAGPRGRFGRSGFGPPDFGPPRRGPRFGPGSGQLPPSFSASRGRDPSTDELNPGAAADPNSPTPPTSQPPSNRNPSERGRLITPALPSENAKFAPIPPSKTGPAAYNPPPWLPGQPTELAGGPEGFQFERCDRLRKTVIGFRYRMGSWANQPSVAELDPIYVRQQSNTANSHIAREGYVVGGVQVVSGEFVNAVRIIFVREQSDGTLDKTDHYLSDWIGEPGDSPPKPLGDGLTRVIGICGRRGAVLNALALVLDKQPDLDKQTVPDRQLDK